MEVYQPARTPVKPPFLPVPLPDWGVAAATEPLPASPPTSSRFHLAVLGLYSQPSGRRDRTSPRRAEEQGGVFMNARRWLATLGAGALLTAGLIAVPMAGASQEEDDREGPDVAITGDALDRASAAALAH